MLQTKLVLHYLRRNEVLLSDDAPQMWPLLKKLLSLFRFAIIRKYFHDGDPCLGYHAEGEPSSWLYKTEAGRRFIRKHLVYEKKMGVGTISLEHLKVDALTSHSKGKPINMFDMRGLAPKKIVRAKIKATLQNLSDLGDEEITSIQKELIGTIAFDLFGLPYYTEGLLLESGSRANEIALAVARRETGKSKVLVTNLTHHSIIFACERLQLEPIVIDVSPVDFLTVSEEKLKRILREHGHEIGIVVVTVGTTQTGTVETFIKEPYLQKFIKKNKVWVHMDAAYGGFIHNLLAEERQFPDPITYIDAHSITVDPHKFVGIYGSSVLLFPEYPKKLFGMEAVYFANGNATNVGTTRSAYAHSVALATIKALGKPGLQQLARQLRRRAYIIADKLEQEGITILTPVESSVIPIALCSEKETHRVFKSLMDAGFRVSLLHIKGENYEQWGIRMVVTADPVITDDIIGRFISSLVQTKNST